ncbi:hypothetical protein PHAVU_005G001700 [Phaseolus vulgaris]|uniref:Amino acid transporter transmembrane domain-containing protein n=1 Tax=Phaseolus vulgaris TaxID=3885 RepID=V7BU89_PHAVU|nr:hypothetical protein PHAVU_005G001700g [Phaseolus vulgaris]ESW20615.1 hypothetical protein PHAVU_005G001700g [Phaseolus vulgaris]
MEHADWNGGRSPMETQKVENWMPVETSREAKWWYSSFHNVTAMVGAGVLGLPYALAQLGWVPGIVMLVISWLLTFYTLWQLVEMHEMDGKRFDRYFEMGEHVYGPKKGVWMVMPQQLTVQVASTIVYSVTGGKSLKKFFQILSVRGLSDIKQTYYILVFVIIQLLLSQTPNFHKLKAVSSLAAVMSICYSMVAFVMSAVEGSKLHYPRNYGVRSHTPAGITFDAFTALGTVAFAFAGHSVVSEIQATLPSTEEKPSKVPMWQGVVVAYFIVIFCYMTVAVTGFWAFGNAVEDDVLITLEHPYWLIAIANLMVFIHVVGSFQVFAMPVFDIIETTLVKKLNCSPSKILRMASRSAFVCLVGFIGMCVPFFGGLLGFFGGLAFTSTSYIIPSVLWLGSSKPKRWSFHWFASWASITVGLIIAALAPIGGIRTIVVSAKTYKLFS